STTIGMPDNIDYRLLFKPNLFLDSNSEQSILEGRLYRCYHQLSFGLFQCLIILFSQFGLLCYHGFLFNLAERNTNDFFT
ncbi:MAG: hypothetical protein VCF25_26190, partial [Candidatus Poribacteria bacterium]